MKQRADKEERALGDGSASAVEADRAPDVHDGGRAFWPAEKGQPAALWRRGRVLLGVPLLALGALGCVLPIVPGVPLLIAGLALLGPQHWLVRPLVERWKRWRRR